MTEPEDTRAYWAEASAPPGLPLNYASILRLQVHPRGKEETLLDVQVIAPKPGWGAVDALDKALAEHGWTRSWGWGDGPRSRSLVAWLREPADVVAPAGQV